MHICLGLPAFHEGSRGSESLVLSFCSMGFAVVSLSLPRRGVGASARELRCPLACAVNSDTLLRPEWRFEAIGLQVATGICRLLTSHLIFLLCTFRVSGQRQ